MRILFLAPQPFFQNRGTPIAERRLLEFLTDQGHQVDVLAFHEGEDIEIPGCRIFRIPAPPGVHGIEPGFSWKKVVCDGLMLKEAFTLVRRGNYELVHAVEEAVFIAALVHRIYGIPFVYDMDSSLSEQLEARRWTRPVLRFIRGAERLAVRRSLGVLAVCRELAEASRRYDGSKLVACVEDASLLEGPPAATESLRSSLGITGPLALYVGNLQPYQGIELMLQSFAKAHAQVPGAHLVIVGGRGERIAHYEAMADELGLRGAVHLIGPRPLEMLGGFLRQADMLISPRLTGRNTPMKIYSYIDSGVAVLATRLPTHTQVLDDQIAMLADPVPAPFAAAMSRLLTDAPLRLALATRARDRARRQFSTEAANRKLGRFFAAVERKLGAPSAGRTPAA